MISAKPFLRALTTSALIAAALGAAPRDKDWDDVRPGLTLEYPRDHGAHARHQTEWWYLTGNVEDVAGRRFGYQFTIFRRGLDPEPLAEDAAPLRARALYAGHLAITDVAGDTTHFAERLRRGAAPFASASEEDLDLVLEDWSLVRSESGSLVVAAADPATGLALELSLSPQKPLVLHGEGGYSRKGLDEGNASAYASWTRLASRGTLTVAGESHAITGDSWFDHEFGSSVLEDDVEGWDWFGLQLDDGRELMAFYLRKEDGSLSVVSAGTLVDGEGRVTPLLLADFRIETSARWTSPKTGTTYPASWNLKVPSQRIDLQLTPLVADCELHTGGSTGIVYWEGPVRIEGSATGHGYAELTGYSGSMSGRF